MPCTITRVFLPTEVHAKTIPWSGAKSAVKNAGDVQQMLNTIKSMAQGHRDANRALNAGYDGSSPGGPPTAGPAAPVPIPAVAGLRAAAGSVVASSPAAVASYSDQSAVPSSLVTGGSPHRGSNATPDSGGSVINNYFPRSVQRGSVIEHMHAPGKPLPKPQFAADSSSESLVSDASGASSGGSSAVPLRRAGSAISIVSAGQTAGLPRSGSTIGNSSSNASLPSIGRSGSTHSLKENHGPDATQSAPLPPTGARPRVTPLTVNTAGGVTASSSTGNLPHASSTSASAAAAAARQGMVSPRTPKSPMMFIPAGALSLIHI